MGASSKPKTSHKKLNRKSPHLLPALVAVGGACGLAALPSSALELGEAQVNSALGQPLRASIAYALNPTEQIFDYCIYLRPGASASGIPTLSNARIAVTDRSIILTGTTPIREPMMNVQVVVDCAYTPHLLREYTLMVDPVAPVVSARSTVPSRSVAESPAQQPSVPAPVVAENRRPQAAPAPTTRSNSAATSIAMNANYRVRPGDTVSTIVSRVQDRSIGLWPAVDIIFAANPDAFVNQDVNRLMAGSVLFIPQLTDSAAPAQTAVAYSPAAGSELSEPVTEMVGDMAPAGVDQVSATPATDSAISAPASVANAGVTPAEDVAASEVAEPAAIERPALRPGDVILSPIDTNGTEIVIPDTAIDNDLPIVPVVETTPAEITGMTGAWGWLIWLGGTGIALILGLLLFGRTLRERFGSASSVTMEAPARRRNDDPTQKNRVVKGVDFEFEDSVNAQAISLDADLGAGTGLNPGADMDLAQDFGFSATGQTHTALDMEITEQAAREPEASPTDVIPPHHREDVSTILEAEVPPSDSDATGEYDLSMIVDATKQPLGDYDATAKDLQAVQVENVDNGFDDDVDDYTMSSAVDYQALEQDYEEEFTATQALNSEMEQAARELAESMAAADADHITAEIQTAANPDKATVELPEVSDPDITAELTANLPTTVEAQNDSQVDDGSEITIEMSAAGSDVTVEMQVESGRIDTRKKRG